VMASHSCARAVRNHPRNLPDNLLRAIATNGGVVQLCVLSWYVKETAISEARDSAFSALARRWDLPETLTAEQQELKWREEEALDRQFPAVLATVADAVDHLDHMVRIMGIDHVGIGTDMDGGGALADCYDVSELPALTVELVRRGYSEADIASIWGGNLLRVFRSVEAAADAAVCSRIVV
jgi:membrane dipeptidase